MMLHLLALSVPPLFARGGGGGSGGGGGGGGGGSGSGGGGIGGIAIIGYFPTHYVTSWALGRSESRSVAVVFGTITGIAITAACSFAGPVFGFFVAIGAIIGVYSGTHDLISRLTQNIKRSKEVVKIAASKDPAWQADRLQQRIRTVFNMYQRDWSDLRTDRLTTYATPAYAHYAYLMMLALHQMGRRNVMESWTISDVTITDASDAPDDSHDTFTASISAGADDQLIDAATKKLLNRDTSSFKEFWTFVRKGDDWLLDHIEQVTADAGLASLKLRSFAQANNMYYSLDWGSLLLPARGQLFRGGSFKHSDINNHVIGDWQGLLVQLYTYIPYQRSNKQEYLIGQISLPKIYGGIIIRRKSTWSWIRPKPRHYQQVSFEWPDFNKRYDVYATDIEQVTAFELLNPKTMADLYDKDLPINIEVIDKTVYFYCRATVSADKYEQMLSVLQLAHKELKR